MEELKEGGRSYLERIATSLGDRGISAKSEIRSGEVPMEIIRFADEIQARLVAMSKRGRAGISPLDLGSVSDRVLRRGTTPVLLVSAPKGQLA